MINAADAIRVGRQLLGTSYGDLDCINFIKKIIRTAPGGNSKYTTAGTNTLWRSSDLIAKRKDLNGVEPGMLVFKHKDQPTEKYDDAEGDVHHIGLVTENQTVLHSSSVKGCVIESNLYDGTWVYCATHKLIQPAGSEAPDEDKGYLYKAAVTTKESSYVNIRTGPGTSFKAFAKAAAGTIVDVLKHYSGWDFIKTDDVQGYMCSDYLVAVDDPDDGKADEDPNHYTTLRDSFGNMITLLGSWIICDD